MFRALDENTKNKFPLFILYCARQCILEVIPPFISNPGILLELMALFAKSRQLVLTVEDETSKCFLPKIYVYVPHFLWICAIYRMRNAIPTMRANL